MQFRGRPLRQSRSRVKPQPTQANLGKHLSAPATTDCPGRGWPALAAIGGGDGNPSLARHFGSSLLINHFHEHDAARRGTWDESCLVDVLHESAGRLLVASTY